MTVAEVASDDDVMKIMWHAFLWGSVLSVQNSCLLYVVSCTDNRVGFSS